mgnify:CR=1 FL=1
MLKKVINVKQFGDAKIQIKYINLSLKKIKSCTEESDAQCEIYLH